MRMHFGREAVTWPWHLIWGVFISHYIEPSPEKTEKSALVEYQGLRPCVKLRIRKLSDSIVQQKVNKLWLKGGEIVVHRKRHSGPLEQRGVQTENILPQSYKGGFSRLLVGYSNILKLADREGALTEKLPCFTSCAASKSSVSWASAILQLHCWPLVLGKEHGIQTLNPFLKRCVVILKLKDLLSSPCPPQVLARSLDMRKDTSSSNVM